MQAANRNIVYVAVMAVANLDQVVVTVVVATVEAIVLLAQQQGIRMVEKNHGVAVNVMMIVEAENLRVAVTKRDINRK